MISNSQIIRTFNFPQYLIDLIEETDDDYSLGYTENYIYTYIEGKHKVGDIVNVKLTEIYKNGMKGKIK